MAVDAGEVSGLLTLSPVPGAALLFDIDGTLTDTDHLHLLAFNEVFAPFGHQFNRARYTRELQGHANISIGARCVIAAS